MRGSRQRAAVAACGFGSEGLHLVQLSNDMPVMSPATARAYVRATNRVLLSFKLRPTSTRTAPPAAAAAQTTHLPSSFQNARPHPVILVYGLYCHPSQLCACASAASAAATNDAAVLSNPACRVSRVRKPGRNKQHDLRWHAVQRQRQLRHETAAAQPRALVHLVLQGLVRRQVGRAVVVVR